MPKDSHELLLDLLEYLKRKNRIKNYVLPKIFSTAETVYTKVNLKNWEARLMRWKFDWNAWIKKIATIDSVRVIKAPVNSILPKLDDFDIALLQELTMSARRKKTAIMDSLKLDKATVGLQQKISRKVKFLDEKIISQYLVFLRWETFEIYNSFLVHCECDEITVNKLQNLLIKDPIPFESTFKITENGFLWYLRCPASHFSEISAIIWSLSRKVKLFFLDYKKSEFYGLWKGAFDASKHQWSRELMKKEKVL
jgi:hypothetical protein